jgi:polysaccharide export outer membrane protein
MLPNRIKGLLLAAFAAAVVGVTAPVAAQNAGLEPAAVKSQLITSTQSGGLTSGGANSQAERAVPLIGTASDYRVGAGDLLRVNVFDHPELGSDLRVSQSGNLTFPLIGQVQVTGLSTHDIESILTRDLASGGFVREPQVSVLVVDFQSQKISVMGQVAKPGQYAMTASQHALDALAQAGGVVNIIAADDATLLRQNGTKVPIDLVAMFSGDPTQNPAVAAGDTIYVPRAAQFYVYGQVQHPGIYRLERRMTVSQAISAGGGLTPRGSERWAVVKRRDAAGKERKISVSGSDMVQPDDVLLIRESLF